MAVVLRAVSLVVGLLLVVGGLWYSPAPWLAPIVAGATLAAVGLLLRIPTRRDR